MKAEEPDEFERSHGDVVERWYSTLAWHAGTVGRERLNALHRIYHLKVRIPLTGFRSLLTFAKANCCPVEEDGK